MLYKNLSLLHKRGLLAVQYLLIHIREDGSFIYEVDIISGRISEMYNMLRHAGTLYELCLWFQQFPDESGIKKLQKPFAFLLSHICGWNNTLCLVEDNNAKLGGSALALLALMAYHQLNCEPPHLPVMAGLAGFIVSCQQEDGSFTSKYNYRSRLPSIFQSAYYPGQAILALILQQKIHPNAEWLAAARKGADYLCSSPLKVTKNSKAQETWFAKALSELLFVQENPAYYFRLGLIIDTNLGSLNKVPLEKRFDDLPYGFTTASMASIGEALVAGLHHLQNKSNSYQSKRIYAGLEKVLSFCLGLQVLSAINEMPSSFEGAFKESRMNMTVRVDYVQHVLSVILSLLSTTSKTVKLTTTS